MGTGNSLAMLPWFVRDYIAATRHLSLPERGAYTDLLFFQWELGRLPIATDRLARLIGCAPEEFATVWPAIRAKFAELDGALVNTRLEEHRAKSIELSSKRAIAGKHGGKESGKQRAKKQTIKQRASKSEAIASSLLSGLLVAKSNSPSPSPSPSPDPSPNSESPTETCPLARTAIPRQAYEGKEFHDQVIAAYREALPDLPRVKDWGDRRRRKLNARIRERCEEGKPADSIGYWHELFATVLASDFLAGRRTDWSCPGLEWLLEPKNFTKLIERSYDNRGRGNGAAHVR